VIQVNWIGFGNRLKGVYSNHTLQVFVKVQSHKTPVIPALGRNEPYPRAIDTRH